jgi:hypothetical protein
MMPISYLHCRTGSTRCDDAFSLTLLFFYPLQLYRELTNLLQLCFVFIELGLLLYNLPSFGCCSIVLLTLSS